MNINELVLESYVQETHTFKIDNETENGKSILKNMHIRPKPEWEYITQKPSVLIDTNGNPH